jgi:hypothetical protein
VGQQHILFLILGVCILGIALSARAIVLQSDAGMDHRSALQAELQKLADEAQSYRSRPFEQEGGDGTFIGLTATPFGIARLTQAATSPFGEFYISQSGNAYSVQIVAIGNSPGNDPRKPIKLIMNVWADRSRIASLN